MSNILLDGVNRVPRPEHPHYWTGRVRKSELQENWWYWECKACNCWLNKDEWARVCLSGQGF